MKSTNYAALHWDNSQASFSPRSKYSPLYNSHKDPQFVFLLRLTPHFTPIHTTDKIMFMHVFSYFHFRYETVHLRTMWNTEIKTLFEELSPVRIRVVTGRSERRTLHHKSIRKWNRGKRSQDIAGSREKQTVFYQTQNERIHIKNNIKEAFQWKK